MTSPFGDYMVPHLNLMYVERDHSRAVLLVNAPPLTSQPLLPMSVAGADFNNVLWMKSSLGEHICSTFERDDARKETVVSQSYLLIHR